MVQKFFSPEFLLKLALPCSLDTASVGKSVRGFLS
jgi:hypothetical protein